MKFGKLVIISGPSGCGKGTIIDRVLRAHDDVELSVSMTTRKPRQGEVDGVHYHFTSLENFEKLLKTGGLLEHTYYSGNYYGTPKAPIEEARKHGNTVILDIEVEGATNVRNMGLENVVTVFLMPPNFDELEARLRGRGTETESEIAARLARARQELSFKDQYDYVVVNSDLDTAVKEIEEIIYNN